MSYAPFITDPGHLALLKGQRYVVVRPTGKVVAEYQRIQSSVLSLIQGLPVSAPSFPHVTFIGFPEGTELDRVEEVASEWARDIPSLLTELQGIATFPPPFQTVIVEIVKTGALAVALREIRRVSDQCGLPQWPDRRPSVEEWRFHLSVAYCSRLSQEEFARLESNLPSVPIGEASCRASEAELVVYDGGLERSGGSFEFKGITAETAV